jgi:FAD/FMN-containing dehydrogenase
MTSFRPAGDLVSWGRTLRARCDIRQPVWFDEAAEAVAEGARHVNGVLGIGLSRSYGLSGLNPDGAVIRMTGLNRLMAFDPQRRLLRAQAGISLEALLEFLTPRGFFLPVTPGTRYVTLGGAVANDVHGKNHHVAGTFGAWVRRIGLIRSQGGEVELTQDDPSGLFAATVGGLGLTGLINWAEIEVIPISSSLIEAENIAFENLDAFFALSEESAGWDYTVAWVDCMARGASCGRGLFSRGRHAKDGPLQVSASPAFLRMPVDLPSLALNRLTISLFNRLYYARGRRTQGAAVVPCWPFFYPLDSIGNWNRMYGRRGMYQYQSAVPKAVARDATRAMLDEIARSGDGSFLAVMKNFGGRPSPGLLSFPLEGATLALDFPNRGERTLRLLARLDDIVREAGGRLYPAKDGRMTAEMFKRGYPGLERFAAHADAGFSSAFWRRAAA